jgi:acetolactate synthase regulatory subunit
VQGYQQKFIPVAAGETFCAATVTVGGVKERGAGLWEIVFVIATDVAGSRGRFNFRVEIKEASGRVQLLTKSNPWPITRRRGFTVTYRMATQRDETIHDVEVIGSSTRCMAV